jgi:ABC-2 type transport system permease protein
VSEMMLVLQRELKERVRTRSYAIGTILFPLIMIAILTVPAMVGGQRERHLVVVNEAGDAIGQMFKAALNRSFTPGLDTLAPRRSDATFYNIEMVPGPVEPLRAGLAARIEAREIDGYVVLPADVRESGRVHFQSTRVGEPSMLRDIRAAASEAVQADRLARSGLQIDRVVDLLRPVQVSGTRVDERGEDAGSGQAAFYAAYIVAMVIYLMIALYGTGVTRSVLEEKNNRIAEVLVSSMKASHLMAGKILGVGTAVLLQVMIWIVLIALFVTQADWIAPQFQVDASALNMLLARPGLTLLLLAYFILGFLLFAALFAALGAAVTSDQEAQSFQMLFMVPLFVPVLFLLQLTTRPLEPLARGLGLFPFTAPVAMPIRMAAARIPLAEVMLSLLLLVLALVLVGWLAGKIYRIGILATGRRPTMRELIYWMRTS